MTGRDGIAPAVMGRLGLRRVDFDAMCALYREWNEKINVVSRKDIDCLYEHHILHSLCIAEYLSVSCPEEFERWLSSSPDHPVKVLDLGCGGGFPGIPLAYCFPGVRFTLCDSIGKKITVASSVAASLGLRNVECVNGRAEELDGKWDWVVSRAVAPLDKLLAWTAGKFAEGILCLKGGDLTQETQACFAQPMRKLLAGRGVGTPSVTVWRLENALEDEFYKEKVLVNLVNCQK